MTLPEGRITPDQGEQQYTTLSKSGKATARVRGPLLRGAARLTLLWPDRT